MNQLVVPSLKTFNRMGIVQTESVQTKGLNMFILVEKLNDPEPPQPDLPKSYSCPDCSKPLLIQKATDDK